MPSTAGSATTHAPCQAIARNLHYRPAVAEDRDAMTKVEDLIETMRDIEDGDARPRDFAHDCIEPLGLVNGKGCGWLVHHNEPALTNERPADRDEPALGGREGGNRRRQWKGDADPPGDRLDLASDASPVDHSEAGSLGRAERDILNNILW